MPLYRLRHRVTGEYQDIEANSAQEACNKFGWLIGDVFVRERTPRVASSTSESGAKGGGWKYVTPLHIG